MKPVTVKKLHPGSPMEIHPSCQIYPLGSVAPLVESIRLSGQQKPGVVFEGKLLDGRRRLTATQQLGQDFLYIELDSLDGLTPLEFVLAANQSRVLSPSQRAMVAAKARPNFLVVRNELSSQKPEDANVSGTRSTYGRTRDLLGRLFDVSGRLVDDATLVLDHGHPDLVRAVEQNALSLVAVKSFLKFSPAQQREAALAAIGGDKKKLKSIVKQTSQVAKSEDSIKRRKLERGLIALQQIVDVVKAISADSSDPEIVDMLPEFLELAKSFHETIRQEIALLKSGSARSDSNPTVVDQVWADEA